ncbi:AbrB/MazE/SpoVT family DNA-binding domain-containing protein [Flammeovirga sp. MY04]|uniref:AbrB/MazE/SpoVT family DNA-binding domain-containing protein n=1 Tax=Flammeovirga sp. MY04 TaxID=1191459 RepID=UPI0008064444|nr:AbrB/MazE/SpoVT family DNA-binding domain-containing protein [Flammeovirga sp. MY04]ANQ52177.1 AbrB/MazE/SpoVT family DNA-binding domain-containing protein [Flammeovirga sp. MY04]
MEAKIIQVGNSKGIRLSKTILEKYNISDKVKLILKEDSIVITPITSPRQGWSEAFKSLSEDNAEEPLIDDFFDDEQNEEW